MTFKRPKARILERTVTAGNGPYTVAGAVDGSYRTFASFMSVGDTTFATVVEPGVAYWTGIVTYSAANQITLTTVEETNGTFGAGTKEVFAGTLAARSSFPDDICGAIVTGGTSTAYTVTSFRVYDSLTRLNNNIIAFTAHVTSGAAPTLNVDGLGAKPLRAVPSTDFLAGVLIQGTPYLALYNHSDQVFYLHGMFGNPYGIPIGAGFDYWGPTVPNSAFAFPVGQAISRTTYASLFTGNPWSIGTTYGSGDGSTTFNLPDKVERVSVMKASVSSRLTPTYFGGVSTNLGAVGGLESDTLTSGRLPASIPFNDPTHLHNQDSSTVKLGSGSSLIGTGGTGTGLGGTTAAAGIGITINPGGGGAHNNVQPSIVCNYIMRVL